MIVNMSQKDAIVWVMYVTLQHAHNRAQRTTPVLDEWVFLSNNQLPTAIKGTLNSSCQLNVYMYGRS